MSQMITRLFLAILCVLLSILTGNALDPDFGSFAGRVASHRRLQSEDGAELCVKAMQQTLADPNQQAYEWECSCDQVSNAWDGSSGTFHLTCTSTCGQFCNRKNDVCLIPGFVRGFDASGDNYLFSQTYQYTQGRREYVDRRVYFNLHGDPLACQYGIDKSLCQSCEITPCTSGGAPIEMHCENLTEGTNFDFCADPTPAVNEGVFEFLNPEDFTICTPLPLSAPVQSTPPPVPSPTIRPMLGKVVPEEGGAAQNRVSSRGVVAPHQSAVLLVILLSVVTLVSFVS
jgi:hypothetical protein